MADTMSGGNYTHDIGYVDALKMFFQRYIDFAGRSNRGEYWKAILLYIVIYLVLAVIDVTIGTMVLAGLWGLACLVPGIAIGVRRLHDIGKSGWWLLLSFIPIIGAIVLIYFFIQPPESNPNKWG